MLDVLSSFPFDYMTLRWRRLPGNNPHYIVTLINIMPLMKLIRYYTFNSNIYYLFTVNCLYHNYFLRRYTTVQLYRVKLFSVFWNKKLLLWIVYYLIARIILNLLVFLFVLLNTYFTDVLCQHSAESKPHLQYWSTRTFLLFYIFLKMHVLKCIYKM